MNIITLFMVVAGIFYFISKLMESSAEGSKDNSSYYEGQVGFRGVDINNVEIPEGLSMFFKVVEILYIIFMVIISLASLGYGFYILMVGKVGLGIFYIFIGLLGGFSLVSFIKSL